MKKISQEDFISKCNERYNFSYDYSKTVYVNMNTKIIITCKLHGDFTKHPYAHIRGSGCSGCSAGFRYDNFVEKACCKHNDKYKYPNSVLVNKRIEIECPIHGSFWQLPGQHILGSGCRKCARAVPQKTKRTTEQFIIDSIAIHGANFTYDHTIYDGLSKKVIITCPTHGDFSQRAKDHLQRRAGCPKCAHQLKMTTETFIAKARKKHGKQYSYNKTEYTSVFNEVIITCRTHGDFTQIASSHLKGRGCRKCSKTFSQKEEQWLDDNNIPNTTANRQVRIKLANKSVHVDGFIPETNTVYEFLGDF